MKYLPSTVLNQMLALVSLSTSMRRAWEGDSNIKALKPTNGKVLLGGELCIPRFIDMALTLIRVIAMSAMYSNHKLVINQRLAFDLWSSLAPDSSLPGSMCKPWLH